MDQAPRLSHHLPFTLTFYKMQLNLLPLITCKSAMVVISIHKLPSGYISEFWLLGKCRKSQGCQNYLVTAWVLFAVPSFLQSTLYSHLIANPRPQGDKGHFLNTGQHGGGEDLLQNLRDVLGIHGNERPACGQSSLKPGCLIA